jgi:cellulose synthase (UDP-forming)
MSLIKANPPEKKELRTIRLLIWTGLLLMILFLVWFINPHHIGNLFLYSLLTFALGFRLLRMLHEWYHYYHISVPEKPVLEYPFKVDVFTTACPGEPCEMIIRTLEAIQEIKYPHTTYLCDEGDDPVYREACKRLGVIHVTRSEKVNAKAGNINNALQQAKGDLCLILDPDHIPHPEFLDRVVPYFQNPELGYVQVVQAYYNRKESLVAYGAAEQTYHFYGPMMMSMNSYGTAQAIGANCTFRRAALDSIGGHAPGLAEDMHTAMRIHAKGWKSIYVPEVLSKGLVPSTLPSYYKQQLKWSRGTFELLYTTYFRLFSGFTWRQKLHYFTLPLYYLFGLVNLIEILVPALAIMMAVFPWNVNLAEFLIMYLPLFFTSLGIRQYAQRWLLEKHEKGFHLVGGILRTGSWWVYVLGFVYTIIRKKVPYIPTAKDDKPRNNWRVSIPNILACLFSLGAIIYSAKAYGRGAFFHPYNLLMVGFVFTNVTILGLVVMAGQERFMVSVVEFIRAQVRGFPAVKSLKYRIGQLRRGLLYSLRNYPVYISLTVILVAIGIVAMREMNTYKIQAQKPIEVHKKEPFYTGIYVPELESSPFPKTLQSYEEAMGTRFSIASIYQAWGTRSLEEFPLDFIRKSHQSGRVPMITWEPWSNTFPESGSRPALAENRKIMEAISEGYFDNYLRAYAKKVRETEGPIFLRFAHEPDNPQYPWSPAGENTPEEYVQAWRYVVDLFREEKADNVRWVWNPWKAVNIYDYYPGDQYVDWIGFTILNYGYAASDADWHSFSALYEPFRFQIAFAEDESIMKKPVMIAEFGSTAYGGDQAEWINEALYRIRERYPEIMSVVFFYSDQDKNWATDWRPSPDAAYIDWTFADSVKSMQLVRENLAEKPFSNKPNGELGKIK